MVPFGSTPGTREDKDYFCVPADDLEVEIPPSTGWILCNHGADPAPTMTIVGPDVDVVGDADSNASSLGDPPALVSVGGLGLGGGEGGEDGEGGVGDSEFPDLGYL